MHICITDSLCCTVETNSKKKEKETNSTFLSTVDFLQKAQKSQLTQLPQVTHGKPILTASEKNRGQIQKKIMNTMNKNIHFPESLEIPNQEITRWKQRVQKKENEKKDWSSQTQKRNKS